MKYFETELLKHARTNEDDVYQFILSDWKNYHKNISFNNYMQEVFLYKTGLISINTLPVIDVNGYVPVITFNQENIYNEPSGSKKIAMNYMSQKNAEMKIADYLVKYKLPFLDLNKVKELLK
jgi:hypothetical protein